MITLISPDNKWVAIATNPLEKRPTLRLETIIGQGELSFEIVEDPTHSHRRGDEEKIIHFKLGGYLFDIKLHVIGEGGKIFSGGNMIAEYDGVWDKRGRYSITPYKDGQPIPGKQEETNPLDYIIGLIQQQKS